MFTWWGLYKSAPYELTIDDSSERTKSEVERLLICNNTQTHNSESLADTQEEGEEYGSRVDT